MVNPSGSVEGGATTAEPSSEPSATTESSTTESSTTESSTTGSSTTESSTTGSSTTVSSTVVFPEAASAICCSYALLAAKNAVGSFMGFPSES